MDPKPITLIGVIARLEPLAPCHAAGLLEVGRDERVWQFLKRDPLTDLHSSAAYIDDALANAARGDELPFAIIHQPSGRIAGSTRYLEIHRADRGLEIGWTWLGTEFQRTALNTECKLMLLKHAFETLGCVRVQLKTDGRNERSQRAIERLGAVREGVLRRNTLTRNGFIRDTVYYSILDNEWPAIRARLERKLQRPL